MRLLNVHNLEFREFYSRPIPTYAIASHRWASGDGEDREATYLDVKERRNEHTTGFRKVQDFAKYVETHIYGVDWLWIDTCCINKQDAAELSEAINSMFRWYRDSAVCIAWMADVTTAHDHEGFESSVWFKRGWTLQELLAPRAMIFLARDWRILGHKSSDTSRNTGLPLHLGASLNASITQITGIPDSVLRNFENGKSLSVEACLAWMKDRKTTKEEDMWYCLVGILDAPIVAAYGEGIAHAERRLRAEASRDDSYLEKLPIAQGAAFDDMENELVSECLPETRVKLLEDINVWACSERGQCIFWLVGMAGTGKSTIFKTVAHTFREQCRLAASFCFKKGEADRGDASRLIPTISAQLARQIPEVRQNVVSVLQENPDVVRKSLREQFENLILRPLEHCEPWPAGRSAWVIGIDALDECDGDTDIGIVIGLFARLEKLGTAKIRLFITSRPDLPVRLGFVDIPANTHVDVRLEKVTEDDIKHDIALYLRHRLAEIRSRYAQLYDTSTIGTNWPGNDVVKALVDMAQPLFIFAATACRLLGELDEDLNEALDSVLKHRLDASQLDMTYGPVLERLSRGKTGKQQDRIVHDFQILVGAIVLVQEPLPVPALSSLLELPRSTVDARLSRLHSVLDVPDVGDDSRAVRPLHLSFRDYLTDTATRSKSRFWIDEVQTHRSLAKQCLRLLGVWPLKQDLCAVRQPGTRRSAVSREYVANHIPADVAYACKYWVWHLVKGGKQICDDGQVHRFLKTHFLHWLEALSWLGKLSGAILLISDLNSTVKVERGEQLLAFLADAGRFLLRFRYVIDLAPLQIYSSALVFAPMQSIVRGQFEGSIPQWIELRPRVPSNWNAEIQTLEGHQHIVHALAFSSDGKTIASGSHDCTVRLWNASTGQEKFRLEGHSSPVLAVAFLPDGYTLATASEEMTLVWDSRTGQIVQEIKRQLLEKHDDRECIEGIIFSPDMAITAVQSRHRTIRLWDTWTGTEISEIKGDFETAGNTIAFFPDGQYLALGEYGRAPVLYESSTGEQIYDFWDYPDDLDDEDDPDDPDNSDDKMMVLVSYPDGKSLACGFWDGTVFLWDTSTGKRTHKLDGHEESVSALAFSPDGRVLASGANDCRIWNARTGESITTLKGHSKYIISLAFSPDGRVLATGSPDDTITLWDIGVIEEVQLLEGHNKAIRSASFSPDGERVATAGLDGKVRLWNAQTGHETHKLEASGECFGAMFSPDGQRVSAQVKDAIGVWDAHTGQEIHRLRGHDKDVVISAFCSNEWIVSGSHDKTVRLWDTRTGEEIRKFVGHDKMVTEVAMSSDGQVVASASYDGTLRLWDTQTGANIYRFVEVGYIDRLVFSEDGASLTTGHGNLDIRPYVCLTTGQPTGQPRRKTPRVLLQDQWLRYLGRDLLWLPNEYREGTPRNRSSWRLDSDGDTFISVQDSGAIAFIRLKPEEHLYHRLTHATTYKQSA